jgi:hypothetical protein
MEYTINDVGTHKQVRDALVELSESERQAIVDKWNAPDTRPYAEKRWGEYPKVEELIVALWENVVEERASAVISLEADRQAVKTKYPKP